MEARANNHYKLLDVTDLHLFNSRIVSHDIRNHSADNKTKTNTYQQMECVDQPIVGCLLDGWVRASKLDARLMVGRCLLRYAKDFWTQPPRRSGHHKGNTNGVRIRRKIHLLVVEHIRTDSRSGLTPDLRSASDFSS